VANRAAAEKAQKEETGAMEKVSAEALNAAFFERLEDSEGRREVIDRSILYIKKRLREESFARKILKPQTITLKDIQRDVKTDTVYKVVDIEPDSTAMELNFRGQPTGRFVESARYIVPFQTISTELYEKTEQELYAYEMPLIQVIQENNVKDIQEAEDGQFIRLITLAVAATGKTIDEPAAAAFSLPGITETFSLIDEDRLDSTTMLMSKPTFNTILSLGPTIFGNDLAGKVFVDGYSFNQVLSKKLIVSIKSDLLPKGVVWVFTEQRYLGHFFTLQSLKFFIDKYAYWVSWITWEDVGMNIGNIRSIARYRFGPAVP
jgi:hypothetical protein